MGHIAPIVTHVAAGQTTEAIQADAGGTATSIIVYGIVVEGTAAGQVNLFEADGTTPVMNLAVPISGSVNMDTAFRADQGLTVTTPANVTCTVLHSQTSG